MQSDCYGCLISGDARWIVIVIFPFAVFGAAIASAYLVQHSRVRFVRRYLGLAVPGAAVFLTMMGLLILITSPPYPYSPLRLSAEPFTWPPGCPARRLKYDDVVPLACANSTNALPMDLVVKHGFPSRVRSSRTYYRLGNDAIYLTCNYWNDTCRVNRVEKDVFVVSR